VFTAPQPGGGGGSHFLSQVAQHDMANGFIHVNQLNRIAFGVHTNFGFWLHSSLLHGCISSHYFTRHLNGDGEGERKQSVEFEVDSVEVWFVPSKMMKDQTTAIGVQSSNSSADSPSSRDLATIDHFAPCAGNTHSRNDNIFHVSSQSTGLTATSATTTQPALSSSPGPTSSDMHAAVDFPTILYTRENNSDDSSNGSTPPLYNTYIIPFSSSPSHSRVSSDADSNIASITDEYVFL
jgi:hypothetical protein